MNLNLSSLVKNLSPQAEPEKPAEAESSASSSADSTSTSLPAPLDTAALNSVPAVVSDPQAGAEVGEGETISAGEIREMLDDLGDFLEPDVKDVLEEAFDFLAEHFKSDHWKLSERQQRMLARPITRLLNHFWAKLKERIPESLANLAETTPGVAGLIIAVPVVIAPKVVKQVKLSRERKEHKQLESGHPPAMEPEARRVVEMPPAQNPPGHPGSLR